MRRAIDWSCFGCSLIISDALADENETRECPDCHAQMMQVWWRTRTRSGSWSDNDAVLVHVNDDPNCPADVRVRYPGSHSARLPAGYRREYLRSLPEVNRFEREHKVVNHVMHYDQNGRAIDDTHHGKTLNH
jgi:hypothetical protein